MIVLDTHALLWWALEPAALSPRAAEVCRQMEIEGGFASSISIWEIGIKIKNGKLDLGLDFEDFVRRINRAGVVELVPVDSRIWMRSLALDWSHRDPADRVIVATALELDLPLLTKDAQLQAFSSVRCVW